MVKEFFENTTSLQRDSNQLSTTNIDYQEFKQYFPSQALSASKFKTGADGGTLSFGTQDIYGSEQNFAAPSMSGRYSEPRAGDMSNGLLSTQVEGSHIGSFQHKHQLDGHHRHGNHQHDLGAPQSDGYSKGADGRADRSIDGKLDNKQVKSREERLQELLADLTRIQEMLNKLIEQLGLLPKPQLPTPKTPPAPELPDIPAPKAPKLPDTPAPKAPSTPELPDTPAPPAPKLPDTPAPKAPSTPELPDTPAPPAPKLPDTPAPKAPSTPELPNPFGGDGGFPGWPGGQPKIDNPDAAWTKPPAPYGEGKPFPDRGKNLGADVPVSGTSDAIQDMEENGVAPPDAKGITSSVTHPTPEIWRKLTTPEGKTIYISMQQALDTNPMDGKSVYTQGTNGKLSVKENISFDPLAMHTLTKGNVPEADELYYRGTDGNLHVLNGKITHQPGNYHGRPSDGWYSLDYEVPKDMAFVRQQWAEGSGFPKIAEKFLVDGKIITIHEATKLLT
ncbi:MAG: hypothetical protein IPK73_20910 [Candidatus Obscuribacter sp.]|nr:hypothetical protein [Candidatus Obscuribacter sp.]MBK9276578.1 hypothetical protein [Candidatus Obscuribacter sp.]